MDELYFLGDTVTQTVERNARNQKESAGTDNGHAYQGVAVESRLR